MDEIIDCGQKLKMLREANKLTVRGLAARAGCSPGFISLLEKNSSSPTVVMLGRICDAMGISISDFLKPVSERQVPFLIKEDHREFLVAKKWAKAQMAMLIPPHVQSQFTALMLEIEPGGNTLPLRATRFATNELGVVLQGEVELEMDGIFYVLKARESAYFDLNHPHAWHNLGDIQAKILLINPNTGNFLEDVP